MMSELEKQKLKVLYLTTAAYYGQEIHDAVLSMYVEDLHDLEFCLVQQSLGELRRDVKVTRCPLPSAIRAKIVPTIENDETIARDIASRIFTAIRRFGHTNQDMAREFIGELGWVVVERQGGWQSIAPMVMEDNLPMYQAQWRELALALARKIRSGTIDVPPGLPVTTIDRKQLREVSFASIMVDYTK